jgi:uncharacterized protein (TIGR02598 family)
MCAFTLVEVALALGLCAFALTAIVALLPVSLDSARNAQETTRVAKAFETVASELTQSPFDAVGAMTTRDYYFDYEGLSADAGGAPYNANSPETHFTVTATVAPSPVAGQSSESLLRVRLAARTRGGFEAGTATLTIADMGY